MTAIKEDEIITEINDNIKIIQKKKGLTFGSDALLLSAFVKKINNAVAVDLGSGTGVISLLAANRGSFKKIFACEIQSEYADIIKRNIELNNLSETVEAAECDIRNFTNEADIVFTNPPYMKANSGQTSNDSGRDSARRENNGDITDFVETAGRILKFGGLFYAVYRPNRMTDLICAMRKFNIEPKKIIFVADDYKCEPSMILVEGKKGGKSGVIIPKTFYFHNNGVQSEEANILYSEGKIIL